MKLKNLKINKKMLVSIFLAIGLGTESCALSDFISINNNVTLKNGQDAYLYFITGDSKNDYSFVSFDNQIGYIKNEYVNYNDYSYNNYYSEISGERIININTYLYQEPSFYSNTLLLLPTNTKVTLIAKNQDNWYVVYVNNQVGFINGNYLNDIKSTILVAKITGNNVNVRSMPDTKSEIKGFCDVTDRFEIIEKIGEWYHIKYLNTDGYVYGKYVREEEIEKDNTYFIKHVYLKNDGYFYSDKEGNILTILPQYQNALVISEDGIFYKVMIDGIIGYIEKNNTKSLSSTCVVVDLGRQILRVYKNNKEQARFHIITGRKSMQTDMGCYKIGRKLKDYQLTKTNHVDYWIQYNGDEGIHDASWQENKYYVQVANKAYDNFSIGNAKTYPYDHGSHGCDNMKLCDISIVYNLVNVGNNVLVIGPNDLVKNKLISHKEEKRLIKAKKEF